METKIDGLTWLGFLKKNMFPIQWAMTYPEQHKWQMFWHSRWVFEENIKKITDDWGPPPVFHTRSFSEKFKY